MLIIDLVLMANVTLISYSTQDHEAKHDTIHSKLGYPNHNHHINIINQECTTDLPADQPYGDIFSFKGPSIQMTLACFKFDIKLANTAVMTFLNLV